MSTTVQDLEDASLMDERLLDDMQSDNGEFTVTSEQDVSTAFRAIKAAEDEIQQLEEEMEQEIQKIKDFYEPKIANNEDTIEFMKAKIDSFISSTSESVSTPHGKAYEVTRTTWDYADDNTLAAWAEQEDPDLVEVERSVSKRDLKSYVKETWDEKHEDDPPVVERDTKTSSRIYTT
jgi:vacuolar-type H+-ATPase subunit I/STV1